MTLSEDFLFAVASIAIALIGFSGVVTALSTRHRGEWSSAERLQFVTLVEPSIASLAGAFVPILIGLITLDHDTIWRLSNAVLLFVHGIGFSLFWIRGVKSEVVFSQKIVTGICMPIFLFQAVSIIGMTSHHELAFALSLLLGIFISVHNFYLLLFPASES